MSKIFKDCDLCGGEIKDLDYQRKDDGAVAHNICILDLQASAFEMEYDDGMTQDDIMEMFDDMEYDIGDDGE